MVARAPGSGLPPTHIGIHCGPVVFQDGDIYGSTVNIAARLSARAGPGRCWSASPSPTASPNRVAWSRSGRSS